MSETRSEFVPRDAKFSNADAEKIRAFMNHKTDPNCNSNQLDRRTGKTTMSIEYDPSRLTYEDKDAEIAANKLRHKTNNIQMRYEVNLDKPSTATADQLNESVKFAGSANPTSIDNKLR